jgi:hypothetical protein
MITVPFLFLLVADNQIIIEIHSRMDFWRAADNEANMQPGKD